MHALSNCAYEADSPIANLCSFFQLTRSSILTTSAVRALELHLPHCFSGTGIFLSHPMCGRYFQIQSSPYTVPMPIWLQITFSTSRCVMTYNGLCFVPLSWATTKTR
jgi:hypothetical protein